MLLGNHRGGAGLHPDGAHRPKRAGLTLLNYDSDFDLTANATGQTCLWVVPAGTID
jgi:hypothetical protein